MVLLYTGEQVSKYGFFSGPYFPLFSPNPNIGKYEIEKTPYFDTFHPVSVLQIFFNLLKKSLK